MESSDNPKQSAEGQGQHGSPQQWTAATPQQHPQQHPQQQQIQPQQPQYPQQYAPQQHQYPGYASGGYGQPNNAQFNHFGVQNPQQSVHQQLQKFNRLRLASYIMMSICFVAHLVAAIIPVAEATGAFSAGSIFPILTPIVGVVALATYHFSLTSSSADYFPVFPIVAGTVFHFLFSGLVAGSVIAMRVDSPYFGGCSFLSYYTCGQGVVGPS